MRKAPIGKSSLYNNYSVEDIALLVSLFTHDVGHEPSISTLNIGSFIPVLKMSLLNNVLAKELDNFGGGRKWCSGKHLCTLIKVAHRNGAAPTGGREYLMRTLLALEADEEELPRLANEAYPDYVLSSLSSFISGPTLEFHPDSSIIAKWRLSLT